MWLLLTGKIGDGVTLLLWGLLVVSWVDNIVRPLVISNATRMPFLLVVFGVLGGVLAFGLVGLFVDCRSGPRGGARALARVAGTQAHEAAVLADSRFPARARVHPALDKLVSRLLL